MAESGKKALSISEEIGAVLLEQQALLHLGIANQHNPIRSMQYYQDSLKLAQESGSNQAQIRRGGKPDRIATASYGIGYQGSR